MAAVRASHSPWFGRVAGPRGGRQKLPLRGPAQPLAAGRSGACEAVLRKQSALTHACLGEHPPWCSTPPHGPATRPLTDCVRASHVKTQVVPTHGRHPAATAARALRHLLLLFFPFDVVVGTREMSAVPVPTMGRHYLGQPATRGLAVRRKPNPRRGCGCRPWVGTTRGGLPSARQPGAQDHRDRHPQPVHRRGRQVHQRPRQMRAHAQR